MKVTFTIVCDEVDGDVARDDFLELPDSLCDAVLGRWPAFVAEPGSIGCDLKVEL